MALLIKIFISEAFLCMTGDWWGTEPPTFRLINLFSLLFSQFSCDGLVRTNGGGGQGEGF